jgi:hypothetical protein
MNMNHKGRSPREKTVAQAMIELAVFGAVLFFVIGGIAMNYFSYGSQDNAQLKAMRMGLLKSYQDSRNSNTARLSSSFLLFEDRLTGEFGKYGTIDRQPLMIGGGGMFSTQALQPVNWGDRGTVPVIDLVVNGEAFTFQTAAYIMYVMILKNGAAAGSDGVQIIQLRPPTSADLAQFSTTEGECEVEACDTYQDPYCDPYATGAPCDPSLEVEHPGHPGNIDQNCGTNSYGDYLTCFTKVNYATPEDVLSLSVNHCLNNPASAPYGTAEQCNAGTAQQHERLTREWLTMPRLPGGPVAMPPFFTAITKNDPDFIETPSPFDLTAFWTRFNLKRSANIGEVIPASQASWQWKWDYFWKPADGEVDTDPPTNIVNKIKYDPAVSSTAPYGSTESPASYDVDGDLQEETLYSAENMTGTYCGGSRCQQAYQVRVLDSDYADVNPAKQPKDFSDPQQKPGLRPELRIFGRTSCVPTEGDHCSGVNDMTYLEIKEGKIYQDKRQVSVSTIKKNQYDVVERIYQMNIDMSNPDDFVLRNNKVIKQAGDCTSAANVQTTCFDKVSKTLYIRSRLSDQRGHRWVTKMGATLNESLRPPEPNK